MLRLIGILAVAGASLYLCVAFTVFERRRLAQCEGFLMLVRHAAAQISCFRMPQGRIWESFSSEELERCGFLPVLREEGDFGRALEQTASHIWLSEEERSLLFAFGGELGRTLAEEQARACEYYVGELEQAYRTRREEHPRRVRLYRSLFLTGGLMAVVLLL